MAAHPMNPLRIYVSAALVLLFVLPGASFARQPTQRYDGPAAVPKPQTESFVMNRYCYLPDTLPSAQFESLRQTLVDQGVQADRIAVGGSLDAFLELLPPACTASVYSFAAFGSTDRLLDAIRTLRRRRIALRSIGEPWLNDALADTARLVGRFDTFFSAYAQ